MKKEDLSIIELANETQQSTVQGSGFTSYGLTPAEFTKEVVDAAQKQLFFANFVKVMYAAPGTKDVVIPKRTHYLGRGDMTIDTGEATTSDISNTSLDNLDSVTGTPVWRTARFTMTDYSVRTNVVNLLEAAREELSYAIGDNVDYHVATTVGDAVCAAAAGNARGAQTLFGGDATSAATLSAGETITTDLVAKAIRYLKDTKQHYRDGSSGKTGTEAVSSSVVKNPWSNTSDDPFVLFIGPAQEETFRRDPQFVNAAEYGSSIVIQNGEIGQYLGCRIVVTTNIETAAASGTAPDGSTAAVAMSRCVLMKAKKACALIWGMEPEIEVARIAERKQTTIVLATAYVAKVIHDDAIVFIDVSDE
jgi:N4-gp56 family major capsid protein